VRRAYITGIAGFLGAAVARELRLRGWQVAGCDNMHTGVPERLKGVNVTVDPFDIFAISKPDADIVVHTAAIARSMWPNADDIWHNNVDGTRHVLSWGLPVVHASSSMVAHPDANVYCKSKEVAEWFVLRSRGCALRFGNLWGDGQSEHKEQPNVIAAFRAQIRQHGHIKVEGGGYQTRDFVHISDAASAMATAVESPRWAVADICTGYQTSIISIAEQFGVPIMQVPGRDNDPFTVVQSPARALELWSWKASRIGVKL
jgi:nucleoside-diphosphate-sugar epimerase